jgi:hypothetical protein
LAGYDDLLTACLLSYCYSSPWHGIHAALVKRKKIASIGPSLIMLAQEGSALEKRMLTGSEDGQVSTILAARPTTPADKGKAGWRGEALLSNTRPAQLVIYHRRGGGGDEEGGGGVREC